MAEFDIAAFRDRFTWESDGKLDSYHIMAEEGPIIGDCDDYAVTILAELTGRNPLRLMWWLITFKAQFWLVSDPNGDAHVTIHVRGLGYTDNWKRAWTDTQSPHRPRHRVLWPVVLVKLIIGLFDRT